MIPVVERHRKDIIALCEQNEIKGLWLFGSATTGDWDPEQSDLDFLFDIGEYDETAGRRWMELNWGLEKIFGENFDLISRLAIRKASFKASVDRTAIPIYER